MCCRSKIPAGALGVFSYSFPLRGAPAQNLEGNRMDKRWKLIATKKRLLVRYQLWATPHSVKVVNECCLYWLNCVQRFKLAGKPIRAERGRLERIFGVRVVAQLFDSLKGFDAEKFVRDIDAAVPKDSETPALKDVPGVETAEADGSKIQ